MARPQTPAGISHDPKDAPIFTHRIYTIYWSFLKTKVIAIQDEDKTHHPFLKQWVGMEVDIEVQWSLNNGTLGLDMALHNDGKHRMEYCVKLKIEDAERIIKTPHHVIGILNDRKRMIYAFQPLKIKELVEFLEMKILVDDYIKKEHIYPKGWTIQ